MGVNLVYKIVKSHLVEGTLEPGSEIAIGIDQTLTQDATGTMAYLQFEAMGVPRVRTELSVSYVDHNTLQDGFENADDHRYLQTVAAKHGIYYSKAGNGICHQVHLERFGRPGKTLLGSGFTYTDGRRHRHARHRRRGGARCGGGHGRRAVLPRLPQGSEGGTSPTSSGPGYQRRTSSSPYSGCSPQRGMWAP